MINTKQGKIVELDQVRGLAALMVFFFHAMHSGRTAIGETGWPVSSFAPSAVIWEGHSGVALFMVLSGFVLSYQNFGKELVYRHFLERRVRRIVPLTAVAILIGVCITPDLQISQVLASIFLLQNTSAALKDPAGITGTLWTVSVEFQFYLVVPFLIAAVSAKGFRRFLLPAILFFWIIRLLALAPFEGNGAELHRISYFTMAGRANQFLIGVGLAYLVHLRNPVQSSRWLPMFFGSCISVLLLLWAINLGGGITKFRVWHLILPELEGLVWAVFMISFWMASPVRYAWAKRILGHVATVSFGLYVLHYSVQRTFWARFDGIPGHEYVDNLWAVFLVNSVLALICVGIATLSWRCIEEPFQRTTARRGRDDLHALNGSDPQREDVKVSHG
jgi:peptidoglycan/LPS O-acetylase OafA/YrhL